MTTSDLEGLVLMLRRLGVVHYKTPELELVLGAPNEPDLTPGLPAEDGKRGRDGLTRTEQVELYGREYDVGAQ